MIYQVFGFSWTPAGCSPTVSRQSTYPVSYEESQEDPQNSEKYIGIKIYCDWQQIESKGIESIVLEYGDNFEKSKLFDQNSKNAYYFYIELFPSDLLHGTYAMNFKLTINFKNKSVKTDLEITLDKNTTVSDSGFVEIDLQPIIENKLKELKQKEDKKSTETEKTIPWLI